MLELSTVYRVIFATCIFRPSTPANNFIPFRIRPDTVVFKGSLFETLEFIKSWIRPITTRAKIKRGVSFPVYSIIYEFELTIGNLLIDTKLNLYCIVENFRLFRVFCSVGFKWTYICLNEQKLLLRYTLFCIHIWWWIKHIADIVDHFFSAFSIFNRHWPWSSSPLHTEIQKILDTRNAN